ncbi:hypothetical protein COU17_02390 [Candidatus Kaiserbacteria bacterium CG10_big_fil_rev_8_21_14_0_10_49_17]|uniref:Uncharacterized protein n=1 Tax=Candidatus Kaiserbacteria bacterium CG10_big_fil_rev_8_21_14_0_10_49_17 TaxID=1974609 RepID=A0A2M6WE55_9BACT|nr:MAG: hypothetical protein COU17_02390 [Candidatus Kaiserbacteria bacterium CG10_big_fil_rev_8_21_14_0_10_49_17]
MGKTRLIAVVTLFSVAILGCGGAYWYIFSKIRTVNVESAAVALELDLEVKRDAFLRSVKKMLQDLSSQKSEVSSHFVQRNGVVDFIKEVEALGKFSGTVVNVNSVTVQKNDNTNATEEELLVSFRAAGSWGNTYKLLSLVETMPYALTLDRAHLEKTDEAEDGPWLLNVTMRVAKIK